MAIDTGIYNNIQPIQIQDPLAGLAKVTQLQNAQNQNKLFSLQVQDSNDARNSKNALADAYRAAADPTTGAIDRNKLYTGLASSGQGAQLPGIQKQFSDQDKAARDADKSKLEAVKQHVELQGQLLGSVKDQNSWTAALQSAQQNGIDVSKFPTTYDPAVVQQLQQGALSAQQQVEQQWKAKGYDLDVAKFGEIVRNNKTQNGIAAGNLGVARQRLAYDQSQPKGQVVQSDDGPVLVDPRTGTGKVITGPDGQRLAGVTKPLNNEQSNALLFGSRMKTADKVLEQLSSEGTTTSIPGSRLPIIGSGITALSSDNRQMLDQAKRDFMTAVLRRESGAAISDGEFGTADKQYFPQPGDGPRVIAQKAANRKLAIQGVLQAVPEKQRGALSTPDTPTGDIHAQADAILRGQ